MSSASHSYKENFLSVQQPTKNADSSRKHQTKKQVFGEIKNVIHNQSTITPLKPDQKANRNASSKFISPANIKFKHQNSNECRPNKNVKSQKRMVLTFNSEFEDFHLLDDFDFRGKCCSQTTKSDQQVWSEMNLYSDEFLDNIFDAMGLDQVEDILCDDFEKVGQEDSKFSDYENDESNFIFWPDENNSQDEIDIHLTFEKPHAFDFSF